MCERCEEMGWYFTYSLNDGGSFLAGGLVCLKRQGGSIVFIW